jgi:hypothetical protein
VTELGLPFSDPMADGPGFRLATRVELGMNFDRLRGGSASDTPRYRSCCSAI